jgi:hypothetical protein
VRTKRTKRTKYPLTRVRLGESVRHKRPKRPNSPWSSWKGRKRIALRHGFAMVFSGYRPVSGHVVTSNCQRPAHQEDALGAPLFIAQSPAPSQERRGTEHSSFLGVVAAARKKRFGAEPDRAVAVRRRWKMSS